MYMYMYDTGSCTCTCTCNTIMPIKGLPEHTLSYKYTYKTRALLLSGSMQGPRMGGMGIGIWEWD